MKTTLVAEGRKGKTKKCKKGKNFVQDCSLSSENVSIIAGWKLKYPY